MTPEEIKEDWHIIWGMCREFIDDPADCNELADNIDSFIKAQLAKAHSGEGLKAKIVNTYHWWATRKQNGPYEGTASFLADQIIALFPTEEEIRKAIQQEVCANCDTPLEADFQKQQIVDARKDERERIEKWFRGHGIGFWYALTGGKPGSRVKTERVWQALKETK